MASGFSATVTGDDRVAAMLRAASAATDGEPMELALVAGALLIQNAAKAKAPYRTGTLRRSIHIGGHTDKGGDFGGAARASVRRHASATHRSVGRKSPRVSRATAGYSDIGGNSPRQVLVGTNVPYARRIEFGFSGADSLGRVYNQPARSYLRAAMTEQQSKVTKEVASALRDILKAKLGGMLT